MTVEEAKRALADYLRDQGVNASTGLSSGPFGERCIAVYLKSAELDLLNFIPENWHGYAVTKRVRSVGVPLDGPAQPQRKSATH